MDKLRHLYKIIIIGFLAGLINGLFGAGGGTLVVLYLTSFLKIDQHKAQATAICVILPLSLISSLMYYNNGFTSIDSAIRVAVGGIFGSYIGSSSLNKIPENYLRKFFGIFIIIAAIRMVLA